MLSAIPDIQVSHLSGSYESLCRRSHFGGGQRLLPLQPNAYLRPGPVTQDEFSSVGFRIDLRRSLMMQPPFMHAMSWTGR